MASLARITGPTAGLNPSFLANVNAAANAAGIPTIQITPHGGKRSDAKHPGGVSNAGVGGVSNSNHLTGNAIDAVAVYADGRQVPLAQALQNSKVDHTKYGLRLGTSFDYQGKPDVYHVDDAANQPGGSLLPLIPNQPVGGTTKPPHGTLLPTIPNQRNVPPALWSAITTASQKYGVSPGTLAGIWQIESGSSYPNPYVNSRGYGGLFGTANWNAPTQAQADTAASILATQIRQKGSLPRALLAYSGGGYSSVPGGGASNLSYDPSNAAATVSAVPTGPGPVGAAVAPAMAVAAPAAVGPPAEVQPRTVSRPVTGGGNVANAFSGRNAPARRGPVSQTLAQVANQRVNAQLNPQIAAANAQNLRQTQVIQSFANSLLGKLQPIAGQVGQAYNTAIGQTAGLANQSAQYLQQANPNASEQALLQAIGAPQAQQQQIATQLGNTFNGGAAALQYTQGTVPGSMLATQGAAAQAQAAQLPGIAALKGQQDLSSALWQQGQDRRTLEATRPALYQKAAQDIRTNQAATRTAAETRREFDIGRQDKAAAAQATLNANAGKIDTAQSKLRGILVYSDGTSAKDAKGNSIPVAVGASGKSFHYKDVYGREVALGADGKQHVLSEGKWADSTGTYRIGIDGRPTQTAGPKAAAAARPEDRSIPGGGIIRVNPDGTTRVIRQPSPTAKTAGTKTVSRRDGVYRINADGTATKIKGIPGAGATGRKLTPTETQKFTKSAMQIATNARHGGTDAQGVSHPPVDYATAVNEMRVAGLLGDPRTQRIAQAALNRLYAIGEGGRPAPPMSAAGRKASNKAFSGVSRGVFGQ